MSNQSDRVLRKILPVDYREPDDDLSFEDDDALLAGDVNVHPRSNLSLNDITPAVAEVHNSPVCSSPINEEHCSTWSVNSYNDPFVTISPVEAAVSDPGIVDEELIETISRLSITSVSDFSESDNVDSAESNYVSSVEGLFVAESGNVSSVEDTVIADQNLVEEIISDIAMASAQLRKLVVDLETIMFQIDEINDIIEVQRLSYNARVETHSELKELRIGMVKVKKEIDLIQNSQNEGYDYDERFKDLLASSRENLGTLKSSLSSVDDKAQTDKENKEKALQWENDRKRAEEYSKATAFQRSVKEIDGMYTSLLKAYSLVGIDNSRNAMLRREKEKRAVAAEFDRMRNRVDKLTLQTNVLVDGKEEILDRLVKSISDIDTVKRKYEKRIYQDLLDNDLTEDKLKLAEATKIQIGKFSGVLGKGDDFYTFKSKFVKAYGNHPKALKVEWLKNNHLEGLAKEFVGSLDDIEEIWERLKGNFGNTEVMLKFHFGKINKMGQMFRLKSFDLKKTYVQSLVNVMQDVLDLATEHNLLGDVSYGPQLGKVVGLLENQYQNEWYKTISEENVEKPQRWKRMIEYLTTKLSILQLRASESQLGESSLPRDNNNNKDGNYNRDKDSSKFPGGKGFGGSSSRVNHTKDVCSLCDQPHPNYNKEFVQCKRFLLMSYKDRSDLVRKGKFCLQCLDGKTKFNDSNHKCCDKWVCKHASHGKYERKLHFLLCEFHVEDPENKTLFEQFKKEVLTAEWQQKLKIYYLRNSAYLGKQDIQKQVEPPAQDTKQEDCEELEDAANYGTPVFLLQPVPFNNHVFNIMFDSGCQNFVCRKGAVDLLPDDCKMNIKPGPLNLTGVGDTLVTSPYGNYSIKLPIHTGKKANFSGLCLDSITGPMPPYPVRAASKELVGAYEAQGGNSADLPQVPVIVGGETDFLFGQQYNYYLPRRLFILPTGLAIYESIFAGVDGTRGCIGGASKTFEICENEFLRTHKATNFNVYLQQQLSLYRNGIQICVDYNSITLQNSLQPHQVAIVDENDKNASPVILLSTKKKIFNDADEAGTKIDYKCRKCRGCSDCKKGDYVENISFKEELEQDIISKCVSVDFQKKETIASLPFVADPSEKLSPNERESLKVYQQQTRQLAKKPGVKQAVLDMESSLQEAGYVDWVVDLSPHEIKLLEECASRYYMPWRVVHNENSMSTPVRIVFDASSITKSGLSLNDCLAKGIKSLNSLLQIFIRFRTRIVAIHTDIKKMYNRIKLKPEHWTYQRYWWEPTLDPSAPPIEKVIKTLIYGVKSSGNQAEHGLREIARKQEVDYPAASKSIIQDTYMDDCATGTNDPNGGEDLMNDIDVVLAQGGFSTKGYTMSGRPPPPSLSKDGKSVMLLGTKWFSESDKLQLALGEISFANKHRGKRMVTEDSCKVPENLTKRICASKVGELFDILGFAAPVTAGLKLDIHDLVVSGYDWDDSIPDKCREGWIKNFKLMENVGELKYSRIVIPADAENLNMELIGAGDASAKMTCAACYARFKRKNGQFSCQLILSKTKLVPENTTLPRAELSAAVLNTHVTQIVKRSIEDFNPNCFYVLDSEIALHWICSLTKQLLPFVRNRVIEVLRFTDSDQWHHVESGLNPADLGTRKGVRIEEIDSDSEWINGKYWMTLPFEELKGTVLRNVEDVKCENEKLEEIQKEKEKYPTKDLCSSNYQMMLVNEELKGPRCYIVDKKKSEESETSYVKKIKERLMFSKYLIDPNRFNFNKVVRIFALFLKCVKIWYKRNIKTGRESRTLPRYMTTVGINNEKLLRPLVDAKPTCNQWPKQICNRKDFQNFTVLTDNEIQLSLDYFFKKASDEVKSFVHPKHYENISFEKDGILYFTGRVPLDNISFKCTMTEAMIDLSTGSFIVPIVEKYSPLGFSIVNQVHWYDRTVKHCGVESTIRSTMTIAHILGVRDITKLLKKQCTRCRYLLKKTVDVEMGPLPSSRLCVAPPYYNTQVDLCGHFSAYSKHNKRTTLKVWLCVFVCSTTGMTSIKVMEGYDATQFLLAFSRFACEAGYPKLLQADSGSQLVNGCENMVINMCDISGKLHREYGIDFKVCPVGGHNFHGRVERKIRTIKETISKTAHDARLSVLEWESLSAEIANSVNNLPVAIGNETDDLENMDLITPNRLKLGRNNSRSPVGVMDVTDKVDRVLQLHSNIFDSWWESWLTSAVPKLVPQPKWFRNDEHIKEGDIVLFRRSEGGLLAGEYKYGIVDEVHRSGDNHIRSVVIKYKNSTEEFVRTTFRAVRSLVIIHRIDEINIMGELGKALFLAQ